EQQAHAPLGTDPGGQRVEDRLAALRREGVLVEGQDGGPPAPELVELLFDAAHGAATVAVREPEAHPVARQLARRRQPKAARAPEDERPLVRGERSIHAANPARSADASDTIETTSRPTALKNERSGRPGPTSKMRAQAPSTRMFATQQRV